MVSIPYDELHIYYLSGRLDPGSETFGGAYLGNWEEDDTSFLFFARPAEARIRRLLAAQPHLSLLDTFQMTYEQWQGGRIEPLCIGDFDIRPPWSAPAEATAGKSRHVLVLDPGLVFGSGTHPTTADCLRALEAAFAQDVPETMLDLGTGTGVLAMAAAALGCRRTLAVDLNPLSSATAARNVARNAMDDRVLVIQGRAEDLVDCRADLLAANLHYAVLQRLIDKPGFCTKSRVILSGLLRSEAGAAEDQMHRQGYRIKRRWAHEGTWFTLYAAKSL